jgi:predicted O-linked N-acetylglucosamine transferase (SPINDLY family)
MGADYMDYLIADDIVAPQDRQACYAEKIVCLPDSFMPADSGRQPGARLFTRGEEGLPEKGFVFCCFNASYKITPPVFAIWMRLLSRVEGSVLWLGQQNAAARRNLTREAEARGIAAERLVFAGRRELAADHLARLALADLFLDTLPYNAHATASDALWAGVPILTCKGECFAGRVAASLLQAIGLRELVTDSLESYEGVALNLAQDADALAAVRARLLRNRDTHPLFDTARATRNLESAYVRMWERQMRGEPPQSFAVKQNAADAAA